MGCGLSRNGRPRLDGGLGRRRTTAGLRIEKPEDQFYTPVTTPTNDSNKGRRPQFSNTTAGDRRPQSPMCDGGHPRLQINTQRSIETRGNANNQSDRCRNHEEDENDDDGRRISGTNGVQMLVGSPSFREYCRPGSRSDYLDIDEIGNKENKSGKTH